MASSCNGTGGIAKSYTVLGELQRLDVNFKLFNSRMSGRGLFRGIGRIPAKRSIHCLEDMESRGPQDKIVTQGIF